MIVPPSFAMDDGNESEIPQRQPPPRDVSDSLGHDRMHMHMDPGSPGMPRLGMGLSVEQTGLETRSEAIPGPAPSGIGMSMSGIPEDEVVSYHGQELGHSMVNSNVPTPPRMNPANMVN